MVKWRLHTHFEVDLQELDDAFQSLEEDHQQAAEIAKLRVFAGLNLHEVSQSLNLSQTTVFRNWHYACATYANAVK